MGQGIVRRGFDTLRAEGLKGVWRKARNHLSRKPMYRRLLVLELPFTEDFPVIEPKIPAKFEELQPSDYDELIALRPFLTEEVIRLRLEAGHHLYVAKLNGRIVHSRAVAIGKAYIGYLEIAFPLSSREVYFYEAFTVPDYRRNHLHSACISQVSRTMHRLGYQHGVAFVYPHNLLALRSLTKMGCQKKGYVGFVEGLGIRRYFYRAEDGGLDCLDNAFFVRREKFVPTELHGQIW